MNNSKQPEAWKPTRTDAQIHFTCASTDLRRHDVHHVWLGSHYAHDQPHASEVPSHLQPWFAEDSGGVLAAARDAMNGQGPGKRFGDA